jgi:hypothetical protein
VFPGLSFHHFKNLKSLIPLFSSPYAYNIVTSEISFMGGYYADHLEGLYQV